MFFHYINLHTSIRELGGYKRHVEEELNRRLGEKIFMWETELVPRRHKNVANQFIAGIFLLVLAVSVVLAIFFAIQHKFPWVVYVVLLSCAVLTVGLAFSAKNMKRAHEKTYLDARNNFISARAC
jgi:cobalamin biosynthesis protein CobD/CbiB